jgi:hypothetical protein
MRYSIYFPQLSRSKSLLSSSNHGLHLVAIRSSQRSELRYTQVYSCDYQQLVILALQNCPTAKLPIPYFPTPENAPGACSCPISQVYYVSTLAPIEGLDCQNNISAGVTSGQITSAQGQLGDAGCRCCEASFPVSLYVPLPPSLLVLAISNPKSSRISQLQPSFTHSPTDSTTSAPQHPPLHSHFSTT